MKFGLEPRHWAIVQDLLIQPLKKAGAEVWVFGSRARGDQQVFSDLDILYSVPDGTLSPSLLFQLQDALVNSHLPIKVDIVAELDLAESYRDSVMKDRVRV